MIKAHLVPRYKNEIEFKSTSINNQSACSKIGVKIYNCFFQVRIITSKLLSQNAVCVWVCSVAVRDIVSNCYFPVGRPFSCSSAGRPSLRWVGLKNASLQPAPVRAAPVRAACCRGLRVRRAWRSLFFVFIPSHACRPSGQPFFSACFRVFPTSTRK